MKYLTLALCLLAACTSDPAPTAPRSLPTRPALALATDPVPVPTPVSAVYNGAIDAVRATVTVTWIDNDPDASELNTCVKFTGVDGSPVTTQCVYASEYDPQGSTGERSGTVIVPIGSPYVAQFRGSRHYQIDVLGELEWYSPHSALSAPIAVTDASVTATTAKKGKKR
jgi:hypothetical protein